MLCVTQLSRCSIGKWCNVEIEKHSALRMGNMKIKMIMSIDNRQISKIKLTESRVFTNCDFQFRQIVMRDVVDNQIQRDSLWKYFEKYCGTKQNHLIYRRLENYQKTNRIFTSNYSHTQYASRCGWWWFLKLWNNYPI